MIKQQVAILADGPCGDLCERLPVSDVTFQRAPQLPCNVSLLIGRVRYQLDGTRHHVVSHIVPSLKRSNICNNCGDKSWKLHFTELLDTGTFNFMNFESETNTYGPCRCIMLKYFFT